MNKVICVQPTCTCVGVGDFESEDEVTDYVKCKIESLKAESAHKEDAADGMRANLNMCLVCVKT